MKAPNPIAFTIFGIDVMWYGILIALGFILAIYISYRRASKFDIKPDNILDFAIVLLPVSVIGARLYYVAFRWEYYQGGEREKVSACDKLDVEIIYLEKQEIIYKNCYKDISILIKNLVQ